MNAEDAEEYTQALGQVVGGSWRQVALGKRLGVPEALGISTAEWVKRLGGYVRLDVEERRSAVLELTAPVTDGGMGMTKTAAAEVLGVGRTTIRRDAPNGRRLDSYPIDVTSHDTPFGQSRPMLTLYTHTGESVLYPESRSIPTFNLTQGDGISWARWSWNPVTGCLHGCAYCYAREIATSERTAPGFPVGFTPLFHTERLKAPQHTVIPEQYRDDPAYRRVFVCSMADLYGRWVPNEWIRQVHAAMLAGPQWQYILLTKFPARYVGLDLPPGAWVGTSVDEQKRVKIAEDTFRKVKGVGVKWLSLEPLREPLVFSDLSMFDWVVIGAQTETHQPDHVEPAFAPPFEWVARLYLQAKDAGCKVHIKPNCYRSAPGLVWPNEYPSG